MDNHHEKALDDMKRKRLPPIKTPSGPLSEPDMERKIDNMNPNELKKELMDSKRQIRDQGDTIKALRTSHQTNLHQQREDDEVEASAMRAMSRQSAYRGDPDLKARMREYQVKYETQRKETLDAYKKIGDLEGELKGQEDHFKKEIDKSSTYLKNMSKGSMMNESRFADMMGKVADEQ